MPIARTMTSPRPAPLLAALLGAVLLLAGAVVVSHAALAQGAQADPRPEAGSGDPRRVVIRFLTDSDFPPFNYVDDEGGLTGFNVDLARTLCQELGSTCDIKSKPWSELLLALRRGDADAVIAGHAVTAKALIEVDFTDRYFHIPGRFAALRDAPKFDVTPEGLYGKRIAVAKDTAHEAYLRAFFQDSAIIAYDTADIARIAVVNKRADYVFDDGVSLLFWVHGTGSRGCCELRGGPYYEPQFFGDGMAIAVPKTDPQIRSMLNAALRKLRADGRLEELVLRYFPARVF